MGYSIKCSYFRLGKKVSNRLREGIIVMLLEQLYALILQIDKALIMCKNGLNKPQVTDISLCILF